MAEEVKAPEKNIPRGIGISFAVLIVIMVATNFAYYTVLSKEEALRSDAVAMLFGEMIHPALPVVLAVLICLCSIGTLNVLIMGQPRMLFAAGRNGHMPRMMTMLHKKFKTPWPATFTLLQPLKCQGIRDSINPSYSGVIAIIMLMTGSVMSLLTAVSLYAGFMIFLLLMCLFTLRWKRPDAHRPLKIPLVLPIVGAVLTLTLVLLSVAEKLQELGLVALIVAVGVPVYLVCVKLQKPAKLFSYIDVFGAYLQVCLHLDYTEV